MNIKITIQEPCHESWLQMTPNEQGRHCASCDKTVIDFTRKTDTQIASYLLDNQSTCGRFLPHQLNRNLLLKPEPIKHYGFVKLAACTLLSLGAFDGLSYGFVNQPLSSSNYNVSDSLVKKDQNFIQFKLSVSDSKNLEIKLLKFDLGEFSIHFDYFQKDTLIGFSIPQIVDWEQMIISIESDLGQLDTLILTKTEWQNIFNSTEKFIKFQKDNVWRIDTPITDFKNVSDEYIPYLEPITSFGPWQMFPISTLGFCTITTTTGLVQQIQPSIEHPFFPPMFDNEFKDSIILNTTEPIKRKSKPKQQGKSGILFALLTLISFLGLWTIRKWKKRPI